MPSLQPTAGHGSSRLARKAVGLVHGGSRRQAQQAPTLRWSAPQQLRSTQVSCAPSPSAIHTGAFTLCALKSSKRQRTQRRTEACAQDDAADKGNVAVLGIGLMGAKMARRLQQQGFAVTAWNRTRERAAALEADGCSVAESAEAAIDAADVVLLMLSDVEAISTTLHLGSNSSGAQLQGKTVLQMATIEPAESRQLAEQVQAAGAEYVEAPVLGSQPEAEKGTLLIMVGAESNPQESRAWPVLCALSEAPNHIGAVGHGAAVKLASNQLIASLTIGFATSLALLEKNDVDIDAFMGILRPSALYAPTFDKKLQRMRDREYGQPNFPTKHLLKDMRLFQQEAELQGLNPELLQALEGVVQKCIDKDLGNTDYSAFYDAIIDP